MFNFRQNSVGSFVEMTLKRISEIAYHLFSQEFGKKVEFQQDEQNIFMITLLVSASLLDKDKNRTLQRLPKINMIKQKKNRKT